METRPSDGQRGGEAAHSNFHSDMEAIINEKLKRPDWANANSDSNPSNQKVLDLYLNDTYDEDYAKGLESFIVKNRRSLETITLADYAPMSAHANYLQAVICGLQKITNGNRRGRALDKLELRGATDAIDANMLTKLVWLAPRHLELDSVTIRIAAASLDPLTNTTAANMPWTCCNIETLIISYCQLDAAYLTSFLRTLSHLSSLKVVIISFDDLDMDNTEKSNATSALVALLEHNPNLHTLSLHGFLPEETLFCSHLERNNSIRSLGLNLDAGLEDHDDFFGAMVAVVKTHNATLERFDYEDSWESSGCWGPSSIEYYLTLNKYGRHKLVGDDSFVGNDVVNVLSRFCGDSSFGDFFAKVSENHLALDETERPMHLLFLRLMCPVWAGSEEEWTLKDTGMLYGLLRQSPGGWASAAVAAATAAAAVVATGSSKPAAMPRPSQPQTGSSYAETKSIDMMSTNAADMLEILETSKPAAKKSVPSKRKTPKQVSTSWEEQNAPKKRRG